MAAQQGFRIQLWDVDTYDWAQAPADRILSQIKDLGGGVILMHFQGRHTMEALRQLDLRDVVSVS
jgi:peptidoglycan/xylan/chitin deacetylase (PgdA/CDA1 family)